MVNEQTLIAEEAKALEVIAKLISDSAFKKADHDYFDTMLKHIASRLEKLRTIEAEKGA